MTSRTEVCLTRIMSLMAAAAMILFIASVAIPQTTKAAPDKLESPAEGLLAIDYPNLAGVEPKVAKQVKAVQETLAKQTIVGETKKQDLGSAYGTTGMVYHTYSMFEPAVQCYTNAATLLPEDFRWRHLLGLIWLEQNNPEAAIKEFRKAASLNPAYVPSFVKGGNAALELDLIGQARIAYEIALTKKPDEPAALYGLGQIEYQEKNYKKAAEHFKKVLQLVPDANRVHYSLALAYRGLNELEKAKIEMSKQGPVGITIEDPLLTELANLRQGSILRLQLGKQAVEAGRPSDAIIIYKEVLAEEPENTTALINLGAAHSMTRNYAEAAGALEKAVSLDPQNNVALYNLGVVYSMENKPFQAISSFKSILKVKPKDVETRYLLARELKKAELYDESIAIYRTVVDDSPENEPALTDLVEMLDARGLNKEVMERLSQAYSMFPTRTWTASAYAFALAKSPVRELRNGTLALEISQKVYAATGLTEHGFLVVLALAELGRCDNAVELGTSFIVKAKQEKQEGLSAQLTAEVEKLSKPGGCGKRVN